MKFRKQTWFPICCGFLIYYVVKAVSQFCTINFELFLPFLGVLMLTFAMAEIALDGEPFRLGYCYCHNDLPTCNCYAKALRESCMNSQRCLPILLSFCPLPWHIR